MQLIDIAGFPIIYANQEMIWNDAMALPAKANTEAVGGFTDWMLPDMYVLLALAALQPDDGWLWSSSPTVYLSGHAWLVDPVNGNIKVNEVSSARVRLVRAEQCLSIIQAKQS